MMQSDYSDGTLWSQEVSVRERVIDERKRNALAKIRRFQTLLDFQLCYECGDVKYCLQRLRFAQKGRKEQDKRELAREVAIALRKKKGTSPERYLTAVSVDADRKVALDLLYTLYDHCQDQNFPEFTLENARKNFKSTWVREILGLCLHLDKAHALFKLEKSWYADRDVDAHETYVKEKNTINKRLIWLFASFLDDEADADLKALLEPEAITIRTSFPPTSLSQDQSFPPAGLGQDQTETALGHPSNQRQVMIGRDLMNLYDTSDLNDFHSRVRESVQDLDDHMSKTSIMNNLSEVQVINLDKALWRGNIQEVDELCKAHWWLLRHPKAEREEKETFLKEILDEMVSVVKYGLVDPEIGAHTVHEVASMLSWPLHKQLPGLTLLVSGMPINVDEATFYTFFRKFFNPEFFNDNFGVIEEAALASDGGFGIVRYKNRKAAVELLDTFHRKYIVFDGANIVVQVLGQRDP